MNRGFGMITALLVFSTVFCVSGTVLSKERSGGAPENERYALLEDTFQEEARRTLEEQGYHNSGMTVTWTRERDGRRSYRMTIHHREITALGAGERERLTQILRCKDFCSEVEDLCIVYD